MIVPFQDVERRQLARLYVVVNAVLESNLRYTKNI